MGRRIRWLGVIMVICFGLVIFQLVNIQLIRAKALQTSQFNPRIAAQIFNNVRGEILAADGTVLAKSVPTPAADKKVYSYHYVRQYPLGALYGGITGYDSVLTGAVTDIENEYNSDLSAHQSPPQTLSQLLFREQRPTTTDDVTLTVEPSLQQQAWNDLIATPNNNDGAVVVLDVKTGAVLAMVSKPSYDPNVLVGTSLSADNYAYYGYTHKDIEGFYALRPLATGETFFPGSTMKVVTSTAAYNLKPSLAGFTYPTQPCQSFSDSNRLLCNDGSSPSNSKPCGGTIDGHAPGIVRPRVRRARDPRGRGNPSSTGRVVRDQLAAGDRPSEQYAAAGRGRGGVDTPDPARSITSSAGLHGDRPGHRGRYGTPKRDGRCGDRQRRRGHDPAPDVVHSRLPRWTGRDLHA